MTPIRCKWLCSFMGNFYLSLNVSILYGSVSQLFGLQVPVKTNFQVTVPVKKILRNFMPLQYEIDADFAWSIVQILYLLNKFNDFSHIHVEISKFQIFKNISSPGEKASKSRYRDPGRVPAVEKRCYTVYGVKLRSFNSNDNQYIFLPNYRCTEHYHRYYSHLTLINR